MKKTKLLCILLSVSLLTLCFANCIIYAEGGISPTAIDIPLIHQYITISRTSATLMLGEGVLLTATTYPITGTADVTWTTSNEDVATVNEGYVVAHSSGNATITAQFVGSTPQTGTTSVTCSITVTNKQIFENGTYFIQNVTTGTYLDIKGEYSVEGAQIHLWELTGNHSRKWNVTFIGTGYYTIQSYHPSSQMYVGVNKDKAYSAEDTTVHQYEYPTSYYNQWSFMRTSNGNYAIISRTGEEYLHSLKAASSSTENWVVVNRSPYTNNSNYQDEWTLTRMLPLSGSEIPYNTTGNWSNATVKSRTNCYSYAVNTHHYEVLQNLITGVIYAVPINPGSISKESIEGFDELPLKIVDAAVEDFAVKSSEFGRTLSVEIVEAYEECEEGSYKIALFVDPKADSYDGIYDYHWLRQDADGLWSHKRGTGDVTRFDDAGKLIIDPRKADLQYGYYVSPSGDTGYLDYEFVCFLSITPWNDLFLESMVSSNIDEDDYELSTVAIHTNDNMISYTEYDYDSAIIVTEKMYKGGSIE